MDGQVEQMEKLVGTFHVTLGGEERCVRKRSIAETGEFRRVAGRLFKPVAKELARLKALKRVDKGVGADSVDEESLFWDLLPDMIPFLLGEGLDDLVSVPFLYAPDLEEYRVGSSDEELIQAGLGVLALAFPLLMAMIEGMGQIAAAGTTSGN